MSYNIETVETALCIWEWYLDNCDPQLEPLLDNWREQMGGTCELRLHIVQLAEVIQKAELEAAGGGPVTWLEPFDWEVIPGIMRCYLLHLEKEALSEDCDALREIVLRAYEDVQEAPAS